MSLFDYLKNIFFILIILQVAPILIESIMKQYSRYIEQRTKVAVLPIKGVLYDSTQSSKHLHTFFKNDDIKAILIKMECPGSAAGTGQALYNEIISLKKEYPKPVIVLVENVCASGGYNIACAADSIISPSSAIIGSIGTAFSNLFQLKEFVNQYKIGYVSITSGMYKTTTDPFSDLTPEQITMLQGVTDDAYNQFIQDVAQARKLSLNKANEWANGKIFTGRQALTLGLIDEIGSAYNAVKKIKEKALIEGEIEWVHPPKKGGLMRLFGGANGETDDNSMFSSMINQFCSVLENRYCSKKLVNS
ncbi:signal peptide peptidase SppA [Candidatus Dependentiae bacterium]|nr:MAG: signal peptide peptidase SppA [Candidatus Dependentiae bacterium]